MSSHEFPTSAVNPGATPALSERGLDAQALPSRLAEARVGPYHLLRILGEGGFGVVYLAERREPFVQSVALKVLKPGMDSRAIVARFELERQALALMDHPGIAKVLDGGITDEQSKLGPGRPYFVMELVRGETITDYCREHALPIGQRLGLFLDVCEAVQHAHTKGVIHRDLKPSNILVTEIDGKPTPKVIDFGVAKAVAAARPAGEQTMTVTGQFIGTPEYMSPEQAAGGSDRSDGGADIDTRADVYALGVVLYKLLTGLLPFEPDQLWKAGIFETMRVIREVEPPRPSTRVASVARTRWSSSSDRSPAAPASGDTATVASSDANSPLAGAAQAVSTAESPDLLARRLRGDLDWICMRALEKARDRRYQSPGFLAADIRRYLRSEPVEAGPPDVGYRARKFVRRNRALVGGAAATFIAVVLGLIFSLISLAEANTQRSLAELRRAQAEENLTSAQRQRDNAKAALDFVIKSTFAALPGRGGDATVSELLEQIDANLRLNTAKLDPETRVKMLRQTGQIRLARGELPEADRAIVQARDEALRLGPVGVIDAAGATIVLARLRNEQNRAAEALSLADEVQHVLADSRAPEVSSLLGDAGTTAGAALRKLGRRAEAAERLQGAINAIQANVGESSPQLMDPMLELAQALLDDPSRRTEAVELAQRTVELCEFSLSRGQAGETMVYAAYNTLGRACQETGNLEGASAAYMKALELGRDLTSLPPAHLATTQHNVASILRELGRGREAMPHISAAITARRKLAGQLGPVPLARSLDVLAGLHADAEELAPAEDLYREELEQLTDPEGAHALEAARAQTGLADVLVRQEKFEPARRMAEKALKARKKLLAPGDWPIWSTQSVLAAAVAGVGDHSRAEALIIEALGKIQADPTTTPARLKQVLRRTILVYERAGKPAEADRYRRQLPMADR